LASNYINIFIPVVSSTVSDVSTRPVLRVRSLDPKAVCHRPPKFPTRFTPLGLSTTYQVNNYISFDSVTLVTESESLGNESSRERKF